MKVYVVESGWYDDIGIDGVYESLEAVLAAYPEKPWEANAGYKKRWHALSEYDVKTLADVVAERQERNGV